ncbi:hypothetical protein LINGRAHAP2_LOCUS31330, partial [Linum grandiflorum]
MSDIAEFVLHHGGRMILSDEGPDYTGGTATETNIDRDFLSHIDLVKIVVDDRGYSSVERTWYIKPGTILADGLHTLTNDADVLEMAEVTKEGVVIIYIEATKNLEVVGDNGSSTDSEHGYGTTDPEAEYSWVDADVGVVHLIDDSDRTSDPEFYEAMEQLGLMEKRKPRIVYDSDGNEEVQFRGYRKVNEEDVNQ